MRRPVLLLISFAMLAPECLAQSPAQIPSSMLAHHKLEFEIASVRENKSGGPATSNFPLDRGGAYSSTGGIFTATNQSLVGLLIFAYEINITEFRGGLMRSLPGWAKTDRFDVNARATSENPTKEEMRQMLQSLLVDRFKLRAHREQRQMPVFGLYPLKPGKTGPQLKPHNSNPSCSAPLPLPAVGTPVGMMVGLWPPGCGDGTEATVSKYLLREGGRDMTMSAIADWLTGSGEFDRPFLDRTGLSGTFDFVLEFDSESLGREGVSSAARDDSGATFMEAMKEQLGLRVGRQDGLIGIFVVDNVEYPSAN